MPRHPSRIGRQLNAISEAAAIARQTGARLYARDDPAIEGLVAAGLPVDEYLTQSERDAWNVLLPATWWVYFHRGWHDAAAADAAGGEDPLA